MIINWQATVFWGIITSSGLPVYCLICFKLIKDKKRFSVLTKIFRIPFYFLYYILLYSRMLMIGLSFLFIFQFSFSSMTREPITTDRRSIYMSFRFGLKKISPEKMLSLPFWMTVGTHTIHCFCSVHENKSSTLTTLSIKSFLQKISCYVLVNWDSMLCTF